MVDFVGLGFDLAFKYTNPCMILADGIVGQMMEKVVLPEQRARRTDDEIRQQCPWAASGRKDGRKRNVITSLELESSRMEVINEQLQARYHEIENNETRWEEIGTEDADYLIVAFGSIARISDKAREIAAEEESRSESSARSLSGPSPQRQSTRPRRGKKGVLVVELNAGQMIEDVRLAVHDALPWSTSDVLAVSSPAPRKW